MKRIGSRPRNLRLFTISLLLWGACLAALAVTGILSERIASPLSLLGVYVLAAILIGRERKGTGGNLADVLAAMSVGLLDPEDERDEKVKMQAGYLGFTVTEALLIAAFCGRQFFLPPGGALTDPMSLTVLAIGIVGSITYNRSVRQKE